jgi:hypothetical protein
MMGSPMQARTQEDQRANHVIRYGRGEPTSDPKAQGAPTGHGTSPIAVWVEVSGSPTVVLVAVRPVVIERDLNLKY